MLSSFVNFRKYFKFARFECCRRVLKSVPLCFGLTFSKKCSAEISTFLLFDI